MLSDPPIFTIKPNDAYVRSVNDEVTMPCDGAGQPKPNIFWRKVSFMFSFFYKIKLSPIIERETMFNLRFYCHYCLSLSLMYELTNTELSLLGRWIQTFS